MRITVEYPVDGPGHHPELHDASSVKRLAVAADEAGAYAVAFTEHPAPSLKWLRGGGHQTFDPIAALSFCAAVTTSVRMMTYLLVLPHRNALAAAKSLASLDRLADGRLVVVAGAGYLRSEFRSLGVEMDDRNAIFDEALTVMRGVWTQVPFDHEGRFARAVQVAQLPSPVQDGGPPILIGGNSARARRRAAGQQGWSPMLVSPPVTTTARTPGIAGIDELGGLIRELREETLRIQGPGVEPDVQVETWESDVLREGGDLAKHAEHLRALEEAGVSSFVVRLPATGLSDAVRGLERYLDRFATNV
ncbi:TIGR03619 family F420-dependent LLM class oxidoreductase [Nocardioides sp. NPDC051685]|uniref:TIGR03619 family F420-dependent LLM class oxidoreductase n=1 Tax=Nocardioides sp. NPDC051685 TaxID=3364334 RepID=UPI00378B3F2A